jgi:hypothetical protein
VVELAATTVGPALSGAGAEFNDCCTTTCSVRAATDGAGAGDTELLFALTLAGLVAVASAGALTGAAAVDELAGADATFVGADVVGAEPAGAVETTTVDDLTRVVVQLSEAVDVALLVEGEGAVACVDAWLAPLDGALDPAGATGGGATCFAAVTVVSGRVERVVSVRAAAGFAALRTLSVGRAGEADRAVASRTCSIIAV